MVKFYKIQTLIIWYEKIIIVSPAQVCKLKKNPNFFGHIIYIDQPPWWKRNDSSDEDFLIKIDKTNN